VHYELLKPGKIIIADLYCTQLDKLKAAIKEKTPELAFRKGTVVHQDNGQAHSAIWTQQKLNAFGWEVLSDPSCSLDIELSDHNLFRSLQNYLTQKKFKSFGDVCKAVVEYLRSQNGNFYYRGSHRLPIR